MISSIIVMRADCSFSNGSTLWQDTSIVATECALYFCTNLYNSSVVMGQLQENVTATWSQRNLDSYLMKSDGSIGTASNVSKAWNEVENYTWILEYGDVSREDLQLYIQESDLTNLSVQNSINLKLNVTQGAICSMVLWFKSFFTTEKLLYGVGQPMLGQPPVVQSLVSPNLAETFSTAAQIMTNWSRNTAGASQPGTLQQCVVYTQVRWEFLTLPFVTLLPSASFCLLSIIKTRQLQLSSWKMDVFASMLYGLDDQQLTSLRLADEAGRIQDEALRLIVKFEEEAGDLHLSACGRITD